MMNKFFIGLASALVLNSAWAGGAMAAAPMPSASAASSLAYQDANATMHQAMSVRMTGNADYDFVVGMIGHHQGAIDMAQVELKYGKDAKVRKLAQAVIKAQTAEIAQMKAWQAQMEKADPSLKAHAAGAAMDMPVPAAEHSAHQPH